MDTVNQVIDEARKTFYGPTKLKNEVPQFNGAGVDIYHGHDLDTIGVTLCDIHNDVESTLRDMKVFSNPIVAFLKARGYNLQYAFVSDSYGDVEFPDDHTDVKLNFTRDAPPSSIPVRVRKWTGRSYNDEHETKDITRSW